MGISVQGVKINNVGFADDIDMVEESLQRLRESVHILKKQEKMQV